MKARDYTDLIGGILLVILGLWYGTFAASEYSIGELRRMGPGWFPTVVGYLTVAFGVLTALPALFRRGGVPKPALRPLVTIIGGGLAFALVVERFGLVPAIIAMVALASLAEERLNWLRTAILGVVLSFLAVLIFSYGLGVPVQAFRWNV